MALHDRYLRRTPFELVFPEPDRAVPFADSVFEEAHARGVDPHHPQMFATLGGVAAKVLELRADDADADGGYPYAELVFHAVHFARAGMTAYLVGTAAVRTWVEGGGAGGTPAPPVPSGYLQLPQHLFWVEGDAGVVPESLDGIFWTATPQGTLHSLLVTGVRADRPGVAIVPLPEAPLSDAERWVYAAVRTPGEGSDFESGIPGAGLDTLYGLRTAGEALKLLARFFAASDGGRVVTQVAGPETEAAPGSGPIASLLPYGRIDAGG